MSVPALATASLGTERHQRIRLMQAGIASLLVTVSVVGVLYTAWVGITPLEQAIWYAIATVGTFAGFLVFIRLGFNLSYRDPSMALAQITAALASGVWAYAIVGPARGAVFATPIVAVMYGMYSLQPSTVRRIGFGAIAAFGATMAVKAWLEPEVYDPKVELLHFFVLATMLVAVAELSGQLSRLRHRLRKQKAELAEAITRIQDLATRDDLTGLVNRRYMHEVLMQEHQRCMRSGHPFCIAMIDLDHFKRINDTHGHAAGDAVLRAFAGEARAVIRVSDVIARWGGEEFLLLMTDTRVSLGRLGVERLRERIAALRPAGVEDSLPITFSAGLTEHHAGEPVADTIARADQAVYAAKAQGRNRVVLA